MNREKNIARLQEDAFDLLIIGGGATGTGVALDAASRGLSVGLVEKEDFSAGTSSRSTKLIHGGVRYLEQAIKKFDRTQFNLVRDALKERITLIHIAPHLAKPIPLLTPLYNVIDVPYFMTGLKIYEWLAGKANLAPSTFINAKEAKHRFPMLKAEGLRGAVVYYDGQFDDARMNVSLALTADQQGAAIANHVKVTGLIKAQGKLVGAQLEDTLSGSRWETRAKVIINATGPFVDTIRIMDDPDAESMLSTSSGAHIILSEKFSPPETGLLIPETEDGRVIFLLPWLGYTLVGTTDNAAPLEDNPRAKQNEEDYILRHVAQYFDVPVSRDDILASWSGLRPLVRDLKAADTASLSRDHVINISDSGLLTIAGGKWTTYRKMALDTVDEAIALADLSPQKDCHTDSLKLLGGHNFDSKGALRLVQRYGIDEDIATYLNRAYGDQAASVLELARESNFARLATGHAYLEAEVIYGARKEAARSITDILARRLRLGFLDQQATLAAIDRVAELLGKELNWSATTQQQARDEAQHYFG